MNFKYFFSETLPLTRRFCFAVIKIMYLTAWGPLRDLAISKTRPRVHVAVFPIFILIFFSVLFEKITKGLTDLRFYKIEFQN